MESRKRKRSRELITSQDVIFEILRRIPVKSLMRFKLTCKYWNTFISDDSQFEELHSRTWIQKLRFCLRTISDPFHSTTPDFWNCKLQENKTEIEILQRLPFHSRDRRPYQVGSLLLSKEYYKNRRVPTLLVYDCINGNQMELPGLPDIIGYLHEVLLYDESTKTHKVLTYYMMELSGNSGFLITSFNTKTLARETGWRRIHSPFETFYPHLSNITIKGIMYWLWRGFKDGDKLRIQLFDIGEEKFLNTIRCADEINTFVPGVRLFGFRGSLGLMRNARSKFEIWVLKDSYSSSWIQMQKVNVEAMWGGPGPYDFRLEPIFVLENVKTLPSILSRHTNKLYWYNMNDQKLRKIDVEQFPHYRRCLTTWVS